jgi:hypothetical protein
MELQGFKNKNGGLATDEPPQDSAAGPVDPFMEPCIVTDCQKCTNSRGCYLNVSTPLLTSNSVTMSN